MAKIKLTPEEEETLEIIKEEEQIEKNKIYKILVGEAYSDDSNVIGFFKDNWYSELEKYYQLKSEGDINYRKKFEKLIDKMDKLIQKHKVKDAY
ncbi:hypothetical protein [Mangrovibacterium diazotrophicum]|uniref:Uncharacterized protein n=1 Tax=Mangrovibacterium diazotrophicum TaxID=1261403 RepID=A0A419W7X3_9BACT|nr:hypothetical protein [Mangrovibacterium diazotrophicum]RKD91577.1 hypothetical protein BC643_1933 [Mangrovibacterium diazotrophicum]